jgi:Tfp pilus assembly protein PilX
MTQLQVHTSYQPAVAAKQRGIVLLLVLIILVVLSGAAIWAAKASISSEQVGNNFRISASATELAELALRYCENGVLSNDAVLIRLPFPATANPATSGTLPSAWNTLSNWNATPSQVNVVPAGLSQDALGRNPFRAPECMIEEMRLAPGDMQGLQAFLITARGFSQDYVEANNGSITSGSDAWVQTMIRF